jgi:hypothetical protein
MNWKKFILLSFAVPCVFAVSTAMAQMRGHLGHSASMGPAPMHRAPTFSGSRSFRSGNFNRFSHNGFNRFHRFHHRRFNEFVFIGGFGFPFYPWWGYTYPYYDYPYGYYPYGYGANDPNGYGGYDGDYGYQRGYGVNGSVVVEVQRRLSSDGYYSGRIDGVLGSGTRRAIRNYERDHSLPADGGINRRLLTTMGVGNRR